MSFSPASRNYPEDLTPIGPVCRVHLSQATPDCGLLERTGAFIADALHQGTGGSLNCLREVFSDIPAYCVGCVCAGSKSVNAVDIDEKTAANQPKSYREIA